MTESETPQQAEQTADVHLTVTLLAPLCIAADASQGNETETLPYIPGASFRGALAWHLLRAVGWDAAGVPFRVAFPEEALRVGDLTPGPGGRPIPLSARTCKRRPGFLADGGHGMHDELFSELQQTTDGAAEARAAVCQAITDDGPCAAPLKRTEPGFVGGAPVRITRVPLAYRRFAARDDRTRAVRQGALFTVEVIEPEEPRGDNSSGFKPVQMAGMLQGPLNVDGERLVLLAGGTGHELLRVGNRLWLGRGRSRGLGEIEISAIMPLQSELPDLRTRLRAWSSSTGRNGFALTLQSAAVLLDPWLRALPRPTPVYLNQARGLPLPQGTRLARADTASRWLRGWNSLAGLPRPEELAIAAGSVFWYETPAPVLEDQALVAGLERLEREGIGEHRAEGFGRLRIADPFHLQPEDLSSPAEGQE